jgi:hypothetical protein
MRVRVDLCIGQVKANEHYRGYIMIANTKLDYDLIFTIPIIGILSGDKITSREEEFRQHFQITLRWDDTRIELTNMEYGFFFRLLFLFVVDFRDSSMIRFCNDQLFGMEYLISEKMPNVVSLKTTSRRVYDFNSEECKLLSNPKFGIILDEI